MKVAFQDPVGTPKSDPGQPDAEQMWMTDIQFDGQQVYGTLINSPNWLQSVEEGDEVAVKPTQVNDWMYSRGG